MGYFELFVIFLGSIGAALLLGTATAFVQYRRTGTFPGQSADASAEETSQAERAVKTRMAIGAVLTVAGIAAVAAVLT